MAITLVGSTITIDSGFASGTATGGTATTLTGSGFSGGWANRIVWITGGTGAGQSRFIRTATATTLTVEPAWDVNPASGSTFSIGYTWADIDTAMASVTVSSANFYLVPNNLTLLAGGFIGSINEHVRFTVSIPVLSTAAGSLWQQGRLLDTGTAAQGGSIELAFAANSNFYDYTLAGRVRWYRVNVAALPGNGNYRLNINTASEGVDLRDCYVNNIYFGARNTDRFQRCEINTRPFWIKSATAPTFGDVSFIENSFIISGDGGAGADSHYFGLTFEGIPRDATFPRPYWVWETTTKEGTYFWNTAAPAFANTFAASYWWSTTPSSAGFYTGKTVNVQTRQPDGSALASTLIGLWDNAGNAAWMEGVNTPTGVPINSLTITTNGSGNYANPHPAVAGQSGLVVAERLKATGATQYGPWTVRARKYGYLEAGGARNYANNASETLIISVDTAITQTNAATVAGYTTLETSAKFYDYYQYFLSLAANIKTDNGLSRSGTLIDAGGYNVTIDATAAQAFAIAGNTITIKASTYTGDMTTTGVITLANGAQFVGTRTDANGTIAPPNTVSITGITAGSRLQIYNVTTATEVINTTVAGTSYSATYLEGTNYSAGDLIRVRLTYTNGATAKLPYEGQVLAGSSGWALLVSQQDDTVYNGLGIDGSSVTEFVEDFPNIQVDINDPDGVTTVERLYAWFVDAQTTADGVRNWFGGIVPEDAANFRVITDILDLQIDNLSATGVAFSDGRRLYRDDGASPLVSSTTGGGSITLYAGKVYTSVISTASPVITGDIADVPAAVQSGMTAQGYTTARAPTLDSLDATVSSRLAASAYVEPLDATETQAAAAAALTAYDAVQPADLAGLATASALNAVGAAIIAEVDAIPTNPLLASDTRLNNLDATVSSRLPTSGYTAPANSDIAAIKAKTDTLVNGPTLAQIEASTVIAKEATLTSKASQASVDALTSSVPDTTEIAHAVWDEHLTGSTHNVANSAGKRLRQLSDTVILREGVGSNMANTGGVGYITLDPTTTTQCIHQAIRVSDMVRFIRAFDSATKVATLDNQWCMIIAGGVDYVLFNLRESTVVPDDMATESSLNIVNEGVQKASLLIPHSTDL